MDDDGYFEIGRQNLGDEALTLNGVDDYWPYYDSMGQRTHWKIGEIYWRCIFDGLAPE